MIPSAIPLVYNFEKSPFRTAGSPSRVGFRGRFIVTRELLELSLQASQNLEMSENLDSSDVFKDALSDSLAELDNNSPSSPDNNVIDSLILLRKKNECEMKIMESGWMSFDIEV